MSLEASDHISVVFLFLLSYRGATETQLVWNPTSGPTDNVEAPFGKFYTHTHTHAVHLYCTLSHHQQTHRNKHSRL